MFGRCGIDVGIVLDAGHTKKKQCPIHLKIWHFLQTYSSYLVFWLAGGFNPSEKYENQLGLLFPIRGKIKMFQNTNQFTHVNMYAYMYILHTWFLVIRSSYPLGICCSLLWKMAQSKSWVFPGTNGGSFHSFPVKHGDVPTVFRRKMVIFHSFPMKDCDFP